MTFRGFIVELSKFEVQHSSYAPKLVEESQFKICLDFPIRCLLCHIPASNETGLGLSWMIWSTPLLWDVLGVFLVILTTDKDLVPLLGLAFHVEAPTVLLALHFQSLAGLFLPSTPQFRFTSELWYESSGFSHARLWTARLLSLILASLIL